MLAGALAEKVTFEQRPEGSEGLSQVKSCGKNSSFRWEQQCEGPEALLWEEQSQCDHNGVSRQGVVRYGLESQAGARLGRALYGVWSLPQCEGKP